MMNPIKPGNYPIHPIGPYLYSDGELNFEVQRHGLTKREYFAALAMQGIWANSDEAMNRAWSINDIARNAVETADALLAELTKEPPQ